MSDDKVFITKPDFSEPEVGFFAVKFSKNGLERGMKVRFHNEQWIVALDGYVIAANKSWRFAFGLLDGAKQSLIGRKISENEYNKLIIQREADVASGVDLDNPNLLTTPVPRIKQ